MLWRKLSEYEPEKDVWLLVYTDRGEILKAIRPSQGWYWEGVCECDTLTPSEVKYWMPLPLPPKDIDDTP